VFTIFLPRLGFPFRHIPSFFIHHFPFISPASLLYEAPGPAHDPPTIFTVAPVIIIVIALPLSIAPRITHPAIISIFIANYHNLSFISTSSILDVQQSTLLFSSRLSAAAELPSRSAPVAFANFFFLFLFYIYES
jgi:hypothetical protein